MANKKAKAKYIDGVEYINGTEFAERMGVGRSAVSQAIQRGAIFKEEGRGINPLHPVNLAYADEQDERKEKNTAISLGKTGISGTQFIDQITEQITEILQKNNNQPTSAPPLQTQQIINPPDVKAGAQKAYTEGKVHKNDFERAKATKIQIELAQMMGALILKKDVEWWWGKIIGSLHTYILPLDDRLSNEVAAICGVTEHKTVLEVRDAIGKEIVEALAQIKNEAEKASAILTT